MICDGVLALQPFPQSMMIGLSPWPFEKTPNFVHLINSLTGGHTGGTNDFRLHPCGPSSCCRGAPPRRSFMSADPFALLMNHLHSCVEEEMKRKTCVNVPVGGTKDSAVGHHCSRKDVSSKTDSCQNSSANATANDEEKSKDELQGHCKNNATSSNNNNDNCKDSRDNSSNKNICKSNGSKPWQFRVNLDGCDQVRVFAESGVLKVQGRQQREGQAIEVRHCITLPSTVNPETLKATFTRNGEMIVSQREIKTANDVTELSIVKEGEEGKRSKQKEVPEGETQEKEEEELHEKDEKQHERKNEKQLNQDSLQEQTDSDGDCKTELKLD